MKILKGWRRIENQRGYITREQGRIIVTKTEFGEHYLVMLFPKTKNDNEGREISPEFPTKSKGELFAMDWMSKHPSGVK